MQSDVRFPRLLDGNFRERRRLRPVSLSLSLERAACATAQLVLPEAEGPLPFLSFLELYTPRGSAGIYRVTADSDATQGVRTYPLRHAIDTLHDSLWKAQTDFTGTMAQFLAALLAQQNTPYWQLGTCQDTGSWKRDGINYDRLDALLDEVREDRRDYLFTYDFSTTPWTLNFVHVSAAVDAEMRLTRNLLEGALRHTRDGMGNRLYLSISTTAQEQDGSPGETTVEYRTYNDSASQALYPVVEITANVDSAEVADPDAWAAQFLLEHALPLAQASADGWEIVKSTGEAWDQLDLGKRCRLAAKREGFPAEFPIERIQYEDLFGDDPERVRVDMNRKLPRFSERLAAAHETASRAYSAARGNSARIKRNELVDAHWQHITKNTTEGMEDCFGVIGVKLDADHKPMKDASGNYVWAGPNDAAAEIWGHLHRNAWETQILHHITDANGKVLSLAEVYTDAYGNAIINAINDQRTGTAAINADRIKLTTTGGTTVTLDDKFEIDTDGYINLKGTTIVQGNLNLTQNYGVSARNYVVGTGGYIRLIGANSGEYYDLSTSNMPECIRELRFIVDPNNDGHYILQKKTIYNSATWTDAANFNIAATQYYIDGVAARTAHSISRITLGSSDIGTSSQPVTVYSTDDWEEDLTVSVDASAVYSAGVSAGGNAGYSSGYNDAIGTVRLMWFDGNDWYDLDTTMEYPHELPHNSTMMVAAVYTNAQGEEVYSKQRAIHAQ